jgi:hypothetical protein
MCVVGRVCVHANVCVYTQIYTTTQLTHLISLFLSVKQNTVLLLLKLMDWACNLWEKRYEGKT